METEMNKLRYLMIKTALITPNAPFYLIQEAVFTVAIEHPEWDTTTIKTFREWDEGE